LTHPHSPRAQLDPSADGDRRYYRRPFNTAFLWSLQHAPRRRIVTAFVETFHPQESDVILDLGTAALPEPLENIFEFDYPHKHRIVAAGTEDCSFLETTYPGLRFQRLSPGPLPFADDAFDLGFSNATIEHVGTRAAQELFVHELVRVTRRCFVSTPNRWFPVELHTRLPFVHWLPAPVFRALIRRLGFEFYAREENLNLLTASELLALVPRGDYERVRVRRNRFGGLPSNLMLIVEKRGRRDLDHAELT
jgi:SAM-dependent methyltransferase